MAVDHADLADKRLERERLAHESCARAGLGAAAALSTRTGMSLNRWSAVIRSSTSHPETIGMSRSRITRSAPIGSLSVRKSIACLPFAAGTTSNPSSSRMSCRESRMSASSSTSNTVFVAASFMIPPTIVKIWRVDLRHQEGPAW